LFKNRTAVAAVLAAAALAALTLPAVPVQARACTNECIFYQGFTGSPGWFQAEWVTNLNFWYIRGVANCGDGRQTILKLGGWVTSVDKFSRASCTTSLPVLIGGAYDVKHCATCSYTRTWKYGHGGQPGRRP
jgi:hypothetical protein